MVSAGRGVWVIMALFSLLLVPSSFSAVFEIGDYSIENPQITLTYTKEVRLDLENSLLRNLDSGEEYDLIISGDPSAYARTFSIRTESALTAGNHVLVLASIDKISGISSVDTATFRIIGMQILLSDPPFGFGQEFPFSLTLETVKQDGSPAQATCEYSAIGWDSPMTSITSSLSSMHAIPEISHNGYLYVACEESTGRMTLKRFIVGVDSTPPSIEVVATPQRVLDPRTKTTVLTIETDDNATCTIDGEPIDGDPSDISSYREIREHQIFYNDIFDTDPHVFEYELSCTNLAGLSKEASVVVEVNFGGSADINVLAPPPITTNSTFALVVQPTFDASTCSVGTSPMVKTGDRFSLQYTSLPDGKYNFTIFCNGVREATRTYVVRVDKTMPTMQSLNATDTSCDDRYVESSFFATDANGSGVVAYGFRLRQGTTMIREGSVTQPGVKVRLPLNTAGILTWEVWPTDGAGNNGSARTLDAACTISDDTIPGGGSGTTPTSRCGNNLVEAGESCDGTSLAGLTCSRLGFSGGSLSCSSSCSLVTTACTGGGVVPPICGDGAVSPGEHCDGTLLSPSVCTAFGFTSGAIRCTSACKFDTNLCTRTGTNATPPPSDRCTSDLQCENGRRCDILSGACIERSAPACTSTAECEIGETCDLFSGLCIADTSTGLRCSTSFECNIGQDCVSGSCQDAIEKGGSNNPVIVPTETGSAGFNWLAWLLIVLGVLLMGGAGYFLWIQNDAKKHPRSTSSLPVGPRTQPFLSGRPSGTTGASTLQRSTPTMPSQQPLSSPQGSIPRPSRLQSKAEARNALFNAFESKKPAENFTEKSTKNSSSSTKSTPAVKTPFAPSPKKKKSRSGSDDSVFDDLERLGK